MSTALPAATSKRRRLRLWPASAPLLAKRRSQIALAILAVLLAGVVATGVLATANLYRSAEDRYVTVALPLRTLTRDVLFRITEEETAVRGYMITTDRRSLDPYFEGRRGLAQDLQDIRQLTHGRPELAARTTAVEQQAQSLRGFYDSLIVFVADGKEGLLRARRDVLLGEKKAARFRETALAMQADIDAYIEQTRADQHRTYLATLAVLGSAGALALAIAIALLLRVPERLRRAVAEQEQEAQASRALAHVSEAVFLVDTDENIRYWNDAAEQLFGIDAGDAVGEPVRGVVIDWDELLDAAEAGDQFVPVILEGAERWLSPVVRTFEGGQVVAVRDATGNYALERARADFVATASHELRTPLTAVYGGAATLLGRGDELARPERNRLLQMIADEAAHLTDIVDQLLISAQLDRGTLRVAEHETDIAALCSAVVESARIRAPETVIVALEIPSAVAPVRCDESLLRQVLVNLVDNAIKYSVDGGLVLVRLRDQTASLSIDVVDHGLGIPSAEQAKIFDKFFRLDAEMTRGVGGSGLGLYISREIVTQLGGSLTVQSQLGRGSTFTVTLPRRA
jgi:two-component system phosphate regulon sensor histidine kinase PhoR